MRKPDACEHYMSETFPVEDVHLQAIRAALSRDGKEGIQVAASDARVLQFLLRACGVRKMVEVGTLYGYSTLCFARALPADGVIYSLDVSEQNHARAKELLKTTDEWSRIQLVTGDARQRLQEYSSRGPFDAVFIDADKSSYLDYLNWAEEHVRIGGLIIGDNTFLFDALFGESRDRNMGEKQIRVMKEFNSRLADSRRYNSCILQTQEGITVAQRLN
ncbi:MAG: O-methyltransferase [Bdellovibrionales bacterium]